MAIIFLEIRKSGELLPLSAKELQFFAVIDLGGSGVLQQVLP